MAEQIEKVGVLGAGLMGHGIAQVAAQAGYEVVLREVDEEKLAKGVGKIEKQLARAVEKGRATAEEAEAVRGGSRHGRLQRPRRLRFRDRGDHREPAAEARDVGAGRRDRQDRRPCSRPTRRRCRWSTRPPPPPGPKQFVGLHYFNPRAGDEAARGRPLRGHLRGDASTTAWSSPARLGQAGVATRDKAGFIVNRLLVPYMLDGIRAYEEGVGSVEEIDEAMKAGAGHPMGPLTAVGFRRPGHARRDLRRAVRRVPRAALRAPPTLRKMLAARWFGRKAGIGFYDYSGEIALRNPAL